MNLRTTERITPQNIDQFKTEMTALSKERSSILRVVRSLVADEVAVSRGCASLQLESLQWDPDETLKEDGIGLDSLEMNDVASRVSQFFRMHEVGIEDYLLLEPTLNKMTDIVVQSLTVKSERLTFLTSGSTGTPKPCTHTIEHLALDAHYLGQLTTPRRVISLVPPHHIYGFIYTILMPIILRCDVVDARGWSAGKLRKELSPGDVVVATPYLFKNLARSVETVDPGVVALSSTSPLSSTISDALVQCGFDRVYDIYGSSETCGIGWRQSNETDLQLFPWWKVIGTKTSTSVQRSDISDSEPISLMDNLDLNEDGDRFRVTGRRDSAVQVAGENVFPREIERSITELQCVRTCTVKSTNQDDGALNRLKAFVVPADGFDTNITHQLVTEFCRASLPERSRPSRIVIGEEVPVNEIGKVANW